MPYVRTRLGRWFYEERGAPKRAGAPAIVLLHGLLLDGGMWAAQEGPLAALGRVVVFDGPGHGRSEVPPPFTLEDHAEALGDATSELGIERAVLVGLSWGGMLAMRVAIAHPARVAALALLDTSADAEEWKKRIRYRVFISISRRFGLPPAYVERQFAPISFGRKMRTERPDEVRRWMRRATGFDREGTARASLAVVYSRTSILDRLSSVRTPTLVICGRKDRATPPAHSEAIAAGIAGARLVWIEESGHTSAIECPEEVNAALLPFVAEQLRPSEAQAQARP